MLLAMLGGFHYFGMQGAAVGLVGSHFAYVLVTLAYKVKYSLFDLGRALRLLPMILAGMAAGAVLDWAL